jgi:hypothetical protein
VSTGSRLSAAIFFAATALFGQSAGLSGLVRDPSGASIAKARLELRDQGTGVRFRVTSNPDGLYSFPILKPGAYDAIVQADGFRTLTRSGIVLSVGDRAGLDFSMQLSDASTSVTVNADTSHASNSSNSAINIDGAVSTVVNQKFVDNMPLNGRSFQSLLHMTPGVLVMPSAQDSPGQFSVNGQRTSTNYFTIDGVSANFGSTPSVGLGESYSGMSPGLNILGGTNSLVSVDAMQEFRIQTSTYAPEYGRTPGAQVSILSRSGSNQFHGTVYDYLRNDIFDARNWFNVEPQPKPPLRQNDFGGTLGGPIRKEHTFFFVSYEGLRLRQPATDEGDFLTASARAAAPPIYQPFVNAYPLPTGPVNGDGITAPLTVSYSDPSRFDAISLRIDQTTSRVTFFARYNHAPSQQGGRYFAELENDIADIDTATAGVTLIVSPTRVNDFRANWSRSSDGAEISMQSIFGAVAPPVSALFPSFSSIDNTQAVFTMPFTSGEVREGTRTANVQRQINLVDTFSMTTARHQLKFGGDFRRLTPTDSSVNYGYGASPSDYQTLLAGAVNTVLLFTTDPITARLDNFSLFAQDTWKMIDRLTLTYGLRWEINTPPESVTKGKPLYAVAGLFDSRPLSLVPTPLWQTRFDNFAPRVGMAWNPKPNTVIRGGFGLFYDLGYGSGLLNYSFPYRRSTATVNSPAIPFDLNGPAFQPLPFTTTLSSTAALSAVDPHLKVPLTREWNVGWERQFGPDQTFSATYVGAQATNLLRRDVVTPAGSILASGGDVEVTRNGGYSHYDGLQLEFLRRMSHGVQSLISYTLSRSIDTGSSDVGFGSLGGYTQSFANSVSALKLPPAAPSDFDARHTFSAAVSWELPRPLRGWTVDGIFRAYSARPLNVLYQRILGPNGAYDVQPDSVPGQPFWIQDANQPRGEVLNPSAFTKPAGEVGNFPRNSLRSFPFSQTDFALRRRFRLSDRLALDIRAEYFNVFNHPNFAPPANVWGYSAGGGPTPFFGKVVPGNTLNVGLGGGGLDGGQAAIYAPGGPRSGQLALKLIF